MRRWTRSMVRLCGVWLLMVAPGWSQTSRSESARIPSSTDKAAPTTAGALPTASDLENRAQARYMSPDLVETVVDPETYILGPQDVLAVQIILGETRNELLPVLPEGVVLVPNVGPVPAAGATLAVFRKRLHAAVSERYRSFELNCYLARARQFRVYVTGEVQEPGVLAARATDRVSDVVERAGGLAERGSERDIEVRDARGNVVARADLAAFRRRGRLDANPTVDAGNVVFVAPRQRSVQVEGAVASPGIYEWKPGDTLDIVLDLAGGLLANADRTQVSVERVDPRGNARVETVNLDDGSQDAVDVRRIVVGSNLLGQRRVFVVTPEGEQRTLALGSSETLGDLVRRIGSTSPEADWSGAELSSHDASGRSERVPVNVPLVLRGEGGDRPLQDGDVLAVPNVSQHVYVSGFVSRPGRYPYRADFSVSDYIGEAGGPTAGGSTGNVRIYDNAGKTRSGDREAVLQRGETLFVDRSFTGKASSLLGLAVNLSAVVISIVVLGR